MTQTAVIQRPWFREFWPWFLMAFPATAVVAGFITLWLAIESADGMVADDYYKQGLAINRTLAREQMAEQLGLTALAHIEAGQVDVNLSGKFVAQPPRLTLRITHPTRAGLDQTITLTHDQRGHYLGHIQLLTQGHWKMLLEDEGKTWRLRGHMDTENVALAP